MKNIKNVILLLITVFMCFSVACTGDPAEEFVPQVTYNKLFTEQTTTTTATQPKPTKTSKKNK